MVSSPATASRRFPIRSFRGLRGLSSLSFFPPVCSFVLGFFVMPPLLCCMYHSSIVPRLNSGGTVSL